MLLVPVLIIRWLQSFNAALKREVLQDSKTFSNQLVCRREVCQAPTSQRHSWCGYVAPAVFEAQGSAILKSAS